MSEIRHDPSEDLLMRAVAAMKQLPTPDGPSEAVASDTLTALREASQKPQSSFSQRIYQMPWTSKLTAALAMAAGLLVAYLSVSNMTGNALAFADVVEVLNKVRSATWKTTTEVTQTPNQTVSWTGVGMFLAPSHERMETNVNGVQAVQIMDGQKDKVISLVPSTKTAIVIGLKNLPPGRESPFGKTFLGLRELVASARDSKSGKVERLGERLIGGRLTQGFRIEIGSVVVKIWADPGTLVPVRVEEHTTNPEVNIVMTDFQVDVDLDESLFSVDVPAGYTVQQTPQVDLSKKPVTYLAEALKMAAEKNNGIFPSELRGENGIDGILQRWAKSFGEKQEKKSFLEVTKLSTELAMKLGGAFGFLFALSPDNDWHYDGKGVELNTPDRPIFWYKPRKDSATYQVLYADLSVKDVPVADAPKASSN
jgi:outer membrane lipoprotein-sorting protein